MKHQAHDWTELLARCLLALIFVFAGFEKLLNYVGTQAELAGHGIWPGLLPLVITTELGGGLLIAAGLYTRAAAFSVGGFSALVALFFHTDFSQMGQLFNFLKNYAIAGGMLLLVVNGAGRLSLDHLWRNARSR
ncbi:DoxX family protein [Salinisphaera orenii]|uniref:DoxX family protein n=1 Tax=Salinisphaera orenii TaxID=856731 RepID=UPI000DBE2FA2